MGKSLEEIAKVIQYGSLNVNSSSLPKKKKRGNRQKPQKESAKVQLIYAFNGVGKTRLSRKFKELVNPKQEKEEEKRELEIKVLYYNAFTEDLFYWHNDLEEDVERKLLIQKNDFTDWVLRVEGQGNNIITNFKYYTNDKLTPNFSETFNSVTFSFDSGNDKRIENVKISRGEESCFIWCVFYSLLIEIVDNLNITNKEERTTDSFNELKYVFIDDPVSSLDENHLIELAVNIAELIKRSPEKLKFVITTHNALFYNVLYSELGLKQGYLLSKNEDGTFNFEEKKGDSNKSFFYHLFLKNTLEAAIQTNSIQRYHFTLLRNLYEKTANFLGYPHWSDLLPDDKQVYYKRIMNFTSHSTLSNESVTEPTAQEKQIVRFLLKHLKDNYNFWEEKK